MKFIDKSTGYDSSIGDRKGFYINYQLGYILQLEVVLIKILSALISNRISCLRLSLKVFPIRFKMNNISNPGGGRLGWRNKFVMNESVKEKRL